MDGGGDSSYGKVVRGLLRTGGSEVSTRYHLSTAHSTAQHSTAPTRRYSNQDRYFIWPRHRENVPVFPAYGIDGHPSSPRFLISEKRRASSSELHGKKNLRFRRLLSHLPRLPPIVALFAFIGNLAAHSASCTCTLLYK
jgi:hypothetical protein